MEILKKEFFDTMEENIPNWVSELLFMHINLLISIRV